MGKIQSPGTASFSALYNKCKHAAKQRNLLFTLSKLEHKIIASQICHYCGESPQKYNSYLKNKGTEQVRPNRYTEIFVLRNWIYVNGIDRKDNTLGYVASNCLPCCAMCNYLKCDLGYDAFLYWITKSYKHLATP